VLRRRRIRCERHSTEYVELRDAEEVTAGGNGMSWGREQKRRIVIANARIDRSDRFGLSNAARGSCGVRAW
jgi:hypothetical protein